MSKSFRRSKFLPRTNYPLIPSRQISPSPSVIHKTISSVYRFQIDKEKNKGKKTPPFPWNLFEYYNQRGAERWVGESRQNRWWLGAARSISWYNDLESSIRAGVVDVRRASDELPRSRGTRNGCISAWPTPNLLASTRYRSRERIFRLITLNPAFKGQWYFSLLLCPSTIFENSFRENLTVFAFFELQPILS